MTDEQAERPDDLDSLDDAEDDLDAPPPYLPGEDPSVPSVAARLVSTVVDLLIAAMLLFLTATLVNGLAFKPKIGQKLTDAQTLTIALASAAVGVIAFSLLEHTGGTPGKRLMRLRLVMLDRTLPPWTPLIIRYLAVFVPLISTIGVLLVFIGVLIPIGQKQRRNAFDLLSRTRVVPRDQVVTDATGPA